MIWLTLAILFCYLLILKIINKESFFFTPIGVHAGFLAFGVVIPAVYVYRYEPVFEAGLLYLSANSRLLLCLNLALICLILGAVTASGWGSSLVARTPLGDDVRLGKVWVVLAAAAGLTALFFYSNAELYGTLLTQIWDTTDVFSLVQSTRVAALYGSTYAIQGVTRIAPVVILLLLAKWYTGSSRGARRLALVLVGLDFICLFLVGIRATQICVLLQLGLMRNYFKPFRSFRIVLYAAAICALLVAGTALKFGFGFSQSEILFSEVLTHAAERVSLGAKHLQYIPVRRNCPAEPASGRGFADPFSPKAKLFPAELLGGLQRLPVPAAVLTRRRNNDGHHLRRVLRQFRLRRRRPRLFSVQLRSAAAFDGIHPTKMEAVFEDRDGNFPLLLSCAKYHRGRG